MPYGTDGSLGINFQNSYGTSQVTSLNFIPLNDEDITLGIEDLISEEMRGTFDEGASYPGKRSAKGSVKMDIDMDSLGVCLRAIMGPAAVTSTGGLTTHVFKPRTADFDNNVIGDPMSMLVDLGDTGSAQLFYDCVATELEFGMAAGELYKLNMGVMGGKYAQSIAQSASFSTDSKWTWDSTSFSIAAAAVDELMEITVKINENAEEKYVLNGSTDPAYVKRTATRTIEVSGTMIFKDQGEIQEFISQTERQLFLTMTANSFSIEIDAPKFRYTAFPVTLAGAEQLTAAFTGKAKYDSSAAYAMQVSLVNTHGIYT